MTNIEELGTRLFNFLTPKQIKSVVQWCEKNVEVATGDKQGPWRLDLTPYLAEPLERFGDRTVKRLAMCFATQSAKTTLIMLGMMFRVSEMQQDTLWVLPNQHTAKSFSKSRWRKWVLACNRCLEEIPQTATGNVDRSLFGIDEQHFLNMVLNFVGSNSPTDLSSRPAGNLCLDECDKYANETDYEPAAIDNAEERTKSFDWPFIVKTSTPTAYHMPIWQALLKSDYRKYNVPCPRCEKKIVLKFKAETEKFGDCGLRWWRESDEESKTDKEWDIDKVKANAHYKCQECGGEIYDWERPMMLKEGIWVPTQKAVEENSYGYHLNSLYSILSAATSLGSIALEFINSKSTRSGLQSFINSWLAEPFDEAMMFERDEVVLKDIGDEIDNSDSSEQVNIMGVDVQEIGRWVLVRRFEPPTEAYPNGRSWLLHADFVQEDEDVKALQEEFKVKGEDVLVDIRRRPNQIGQVVLKYNWRGIMGVDQKTFRWKIGDQYLEREYSKPQLRDPYLGSKWESRTMHRVRFVKFSKGALLDMVASLRYSNPPIWNVSMNVHEDYNRHLNSRVKRKRKNIRTGAEEWYWHELHQDNHLADCESFVTVRALQKGLVIPPQETERMSFS